MRFLFIIQRVLVLACITVVTMCNLPVRAGTLTGSFATIPSNSIVDLTVQGPLDWVHWGLHTEYGFNRKAIAVPLIGKLNSVVAGGGEGPYRFADNFNGYSWSDGLPHAFITNTPTGVYIIGKSSGFNFTVPADTTLRRLKVYVGAYAAKGEFQASLSDGSATAYTSSLIDNAANGPSGVYTITYAANTPGKFLSVSYTTKQVYDNRTGNVTIQGAGLAYANLNNPPSATLIAPTNYSVFTASASVEIAAIASDSDGTITKVEFFKGTTKLGEKPASPYTFTWTNAPIGNHLIRTVATDNGGLTYTSAPTAIFINANGGTLVGSVAMPPWSVDLTSEGGLDWIHWGLNSSSSLDRKSNPVSLIPSFTKLGTNVLQRLDNYPFSFSWEDGTPTVSAGTTTGIYTTGETNGFELNVPASTNLQTLKLYVGNYGSKGNLQAFLSDYSAPAYVDSSLQSFYGDDYGLYTLTFAAASNNQTLRVRFTSQALYDAIFGNVTLEAVTLAGSLPPPPPLILNGYLINGEFVLSFLSESNKLYQVEFTDSLDPVQWQPLTNAMGNGTSVSLPGMTADSAHRFYRVIVP